MGINTSPGLAISQKGTGHMKIKTLKEFRKITKDLPENTKIKIESIYEYNEPSDTTDIFEVKIFGKGTDNPRIRIVPETIVLSSGETRLEARHEITTRKI